MQEPNEKYLGLPLNDAVTGRCLDCCCAVSLAVCCPLPQDSHLSLLLFPKSMADLYVWRGAKSSSFFREEHTLSSLRWGTNLLSSSSFTLRTEMRQVDDYPPSPPFLPPFHSTNYSTTHAGKQILGNIKFKNQVFSPLPNRLASEIRFTSSCTCRSAFSPYGYTSILLCPPDSSSHSPTTTLPFSL